MVVHKRLDASDACWVERTSSLKDNPLEHNLGFFDFGRYHKAAEGSKHTFEKVGELMGYEMESEDEDSEDENDDGKESDAKADADQRSDNAAQPSSSLQQDSLSINAGSSVDTRRPPTQAEFCKKLALDVKASKDSYS